MEAGVWRRSILVVLLAVLASCQSRAPQQWVVVRSPTAPEGVRWAADDVYAYLGKMGQKVRLVEQTGTLECVGGAGRVVFGGDGLGTELAGEGVTDQTWRIEETRCGAGRLVVLSGGGLRGRPYAAYEWLHRLGVRFFHPEQEYVPQRPRWPADAVVVQKTPTFRFRQVGLHLTHPLELGDPMSLGKSEYFEEVKRYVDWHFKNLASMGGSGGSAADNRGLRRGFPRTSGFSLHNTQQGGRPIVDPDDPRSDEDQIKDAIEERMNVAPSVRPELFGFSFNPSEFTEIDDRDAVRQLTFIADYFAANYPDTILHVINHGTAGPPTPHYGVRYYDLSKFAPPNLGVRIHSLMFYDFFRPAPVYGNENFNFLYDFMVSEYQTRRLWYFPEAAWWLTFDIAVPLYLPITIEARDRDIQGIKFMLDGKLDGVTVFGTGQEWGYWQNEYCTYRMAADVTYRYTDCLADIVSPMGPAGAEVQRVVEEVIRLQERDFVYGDILAYLVGTDPETEVAASVGIVFHPLPPSPTAIGGWDLAAVADWNRRVAPALRRMADDYDLLVARLNAVAPKVPADGKPWFDEIVDGVEVTGLRARHGLQIYGAVVTLREAQLRFDPALRQEAEGLLAMARETTNRAIEVVRRREAGYRYRPLSRSIAGGPAGNEDQNWTIYRYRYLNRTHHGYYYTRIDGMAEEAFTRRDESVAIADALLGPDENLVVDITDPVISGITVDFGDGANASGAHSEHAYASPGIYQVRVTGTREGSPYVFSGQVARLRAQYPGIARGKVVEPAGAAIIEGVLPSVVVGRIDDTRLAIGFTGDDSGKVKVDQWRTLVSVSSANLLESAPETLVVPVVNRSTGAVLTSITVAGATVVLPDAGSPLRIAGDLSTQAIVDALVAIGGFEPEGARAIVASTLGYTPETLPEEVPFAVEYAVR